MSDDPFSGKGFDRDPLSEDETAAHREMHRKVSSAWPTIEGLDNLSKGGRQVAKIATVLAVIGAVAAYLSQRGFF